MRFILGLIVLLQVNLLSSELDDYLQTGGKFEKMLKQSIQEGNIVTLKDKKTKEIITLLSQNQSRILSKKYTSKDLGTLTRVCSEGNKLGMTYLLNGIKSTIKKTDTQQEIRLKMNKLIFHNAIKYQDELIAFYPFTVDCLAIESTLIEKFWKDLPEEKKTKVRKRGAIKMRTGILNMYLGFLSSIGTDKLKGNFKEALLKSLTNASPEMASLLPIKERKIVLNMIERLQSNKLDNYKKSFDKIYKSFENTECNIICQIEK